MFGHSELYAEPDTWILGLSYTTDFLEETPSLGLIFWQFLLAAFSFLCKTFAPLFYLLLCSTVRLLLLYGNGVQPHANPHPDPH